MKTTNLLSGILVMLAAVFSLNTLQAAGTYSVIPVENETKLKIEVETPEAIPVNLKVLDQRKNLILSEEISSGTMYSQDFDYSEHKNGKYHFMFNKGDLTFNKIVRVKNSKAEVLSQYVTSTPRFKMKDNNLFIHYINDKSSQVQITIDGKRFNMRHVNASFFNESIIAKGLSLEYLYPGEYIVTLKSGDESYTEEITIN